MSTALTLDDLKIGQAGRITVVGGEGALRRRLLDMGLTPGTRVMVRKMAPMGDPIEIHLRGYELTLRKEDAARIQMEPTECGHGHGGHHQPAGHSHGACCPHRDGSTTQTKED